MRPLRRFHALAARCHLWIFKRLDPDGRTAPARVAIFTAVWLGLLTLLLLCGSAFVIAGVWMVDQTAGVPGALGIAAMTLSVLGFMAVFVLGFIVFHFDLKLNNLAVAEWAEADSKAAVRANPKWKSRSCSGKLSMPSGILRGGKFLTLSPKSLSTMSP